MKILYAFNGTGNGHIARARELVPQFMKYGEVKTLISGNNNQVELGYPIDYRYKGLVFYYNQMGSIDVIKSVRSLNFIRFIRDVYKCPVQDFDLVITDFDAVSAWACALYKVPCISLGHAAAFKYSDVPRIFPRDLLAELVITTYAPAQYYFGIHLEKYHPNIFTPVIRSEVRNHLVTRKKHITVYIAFYKATILEEFFSKYKDFEWHIFTKDVRQKVYKGNVTLFPVNNEEYIESVCSSIGLFTGAGFEGPTEALYLGKKLMVVPLLHQYEQQCNAEAFSKVGVRVVKKLDSTFDSQLKEWLYNDPEIRIDFPDNAADISSFIIEFAKKEFSISK